VRVRLDYDCPNTYKAGQEFVVLEDCGSCVRVNGDFIYIWKDNLELIQEPQYTPITPKVGEKYRVVKKLFGGKIGDIITCTEADAHTRWPGFHPGSVDFQESTGGYVGVVDKDKFTTEYLELVEEPKEECECGGSGECQHECHFITSMRSHECDGTCQKCEVTTEPIKQSIIKKSMSFIKRLTQSSDDKALLKVRFTDDCGNLTSRGQEALTSLVFADKKAELVKLAEEVIAEEKE
jgi:hypothetical protein